MALNIKNPEAERLAHELADETGDTVTGAVKTALEERLRAVRRTRDNRTALADVASIQALVSSLPDRDRRPAEAILGYDEFGLLG